MLSSSSHSTASTTVPGATPSDQRQRFYSSCLPSTVSSGYHHRLNPRHMWDSPDMFVSVYADVGVKLCCNLCARGFPIPFGFFTSVRVQCKCTSQGSNRPSALTLACHPVLTTSTAKPEERARKHSKSHWRNTRWDASTDHHLRLQSGQHSTKMLSCSDAFLSKCSFRVWAVSSAGGPWHRAIHRHFRIIGDWPAGKCPHF